MSLGNQRSIQRPNPKKNMVYGTLLYHAGADYNLNLNVHSRVDSNTFTMGNPMPKSTLTPCRSRLYPPFRDFGFGLSFVLFIEFPCPTTGEPNKERRHLFCWSTDTWPLEKGRNFENVLREGKWDEEKFAYYQGEDIGPEIEIPHKLRNKKQRADRNSK